MSQDAVNEFLANVADSADLRKEVHAVIAERGDLAAHELVELAANLGFQLTATELREALSEARIPFELSDAELKTVVGGAAGTKRVMLTNTDVAGGRSLPTPEVASTESASGSRPGKTESSTTSES
jgi:predicted ribosomally synthesized peptide with nif11-like leader